MFVWSLILALLPLEIYSFEGGIRINLARTKSPLHRLLESNANLIKIENDFHKLAKDTNQTTEPLFKFLDGEFYGEVLIGHPGQKFKVNFNTAWADSWVPSSVCGAANIACRIHNQYNSAKSSTYVPNGKPFSGSGITGRLSTDLVHIGQVNVTNQTFIEADYIPFKYVMREADGEFGLAFDGQSQATPFFYNMLRQGVVKQPIFSFYMNRDPKTTKGGSILFGGIDQSHIRGDITYVRVTEPVYWKFRMDSGSVQFQGKYTNFCTGGCNVVIDTSTVAMTGPRQDIWEINNKMNARKFMFGRYTVPCEVKLQAPLVTFTIGGRNFTLKQRDYIQEMNMDAGRICLSTFADFSDPKVTDWNFGASFLSRFYVIFDVEQKRIGFAESR